MLIDYEKAFDSISWNFLLKTFKYLGFGKTLLCWLNMYNTNIQARVIQCGFTFEPIDIGRGCKQGDPISLYFLYLVVKY